MFCISKKSNRAWLSDNPLVNIPKEISDLKKLEELKLRRVDTLEPISPTKIQHFLKNLHPNVSRSIIKHFIDQKKKEIFPKANLGGFDE